MQGAAIHVGLESLAFVVGGLSYWHGGNARAQGPDRWTRLGVLAGAALGAAIGSRALYVLQYWHGLAPMPWSVWLGGKTIVGGLLGALIGVELAKRALGWSVSTGDAFVGPLLLAMVIGRLGCQLSDLSDLTYGNVTTLPWGWNYGDGLSRHPTGLYEILGLAAVAWVVRRRAFSTRAGDRFRAFMVAYLALRFGLDFLKPPFAPAAAGVLGPEVWGSFSAIQWACLAGLAYYGRDIGRWLAARGWVRA
jgi:phosphatidylglycerol---prolipoprotein diacylglyceryl transferase